MSADAEPDPFDRVWFTRELADDWPLIAHANPSCATPGNPEAAIPSFRAFAEAVDAGTCGGCVEHDLVFLDDEDELTDERLRALADDIDTVVGLAQAHDELTIATATQANTRLDLGLEAPQGYGRQHARRGGGA